MKVTFLHPHLPAPSFTFPEPPDVLDVILSPRGTQLHLLAELEIIYRSLAELEIIYRSLAEPIL